VHCGWLSGIARFRLRCRSVWRAPSSESPLGAIAAEMRAARREAAGRRAGGHAAALLRIGLLIYSGTGLWPQRRRPGA
jgi:hypothetical protein